MNEIIYTEKKCFEIAMGCKTKTEMQKKYPGAYTAAYRNGWLDSYTWFENGRKLAAQKQTIYTFEVCLEIAKGCKIRNEMQKKHPSAYNAAYKNDWLKYYTWFEDGHKLANQSRAIYTFEVCLEIAKGCKTKTEMKNKCYGAYKAARRNGWFDNYYWFEDGNKLHAQKRTTYTYEYCLKIAKDCKTLKEFRTEYPRVYEAALRKGWIKLYKWLEREQTFDKRKDDNVYAYIFPNHTIYIGRSVNLVKRRYSHRTDIGSSVYKYAHKNNIQIPEMTILEKGITKKKGLEKEHFYVKKYREEGWNVLNIAQTGDHASLGSMGRCNLTEKKCRKILSECKTREELYENYASIYRKAKKYGWIDDYPHLCRKTVQWTTDLIWKEVYSHYVYADFRIQSIPAYKAAKRRNMLLEIKAYYESKKTV